MDARIASSSTALPTPVLRMTSSFALTFRHLLASVFKIRPVRRLFRDAPSISGADEPAAESRERPPKTSSRCPGRAPDHLTPSPAAFNPKSKIGNRKSAAPSALPSSAPPNPKSEIANRKSEG